ncbi:hypothetical protein Cflav_PD6217 [Pedosphaera parvula Ellin514]|uniref:Uncharacterized protein n=2 Tax=Pedosphaera TaxID=1032526 RepID=B9XHP8_PEDPL|nr:hypothetical protein Cflav_PD6217 [Pedosphaera parvula Ellin514]
MRDQSISKGLILGAGGDMVLSKRREELFQFEFAGQVRRQCLKIISVSLEPAGKLLILTMKRMILISAVLIWCSIVAAKLGETVAQVETRYGKPTNIFKDPYSEWRTYEYQGYGVMVDYIEGKDLSEQFFFEEKHKITDAECIALAKEITGVTNVEWKLKINASEPRRKVWEAETSSAYFDRFSDGTAQLTINGKAFKDWLLATNIKKDEEKKKARLKRIEEDLKKPVKY